MPVPATQTEVDLMRAIIAEPANDQPRLAYADALDARGNTSYAEFIRVQCELAKQFPGPRGRLVVNAIPTDQCHICGALWVAEKRLLRLGSADCDECCDNEDGLQLEPIDPYDLTLFERERNLFNSHFCDWLRPMRSRQTIGMSARVAFDQAADPDAGPRLGEVRFHRGFVERLDCPAEVFGSLAGPLFAANPVESVNLTDVHPEGEQYDVLRGLLIGVNDGTAVGRGTMRIPLELMEQLKLWEYATGASVNLHAARAYATVADAAAALGKACLALGREQGERYLIHYQLFQAQLAQGKLP